MDALPPFSKAAKLVSAPKPLRDPPIIASQKMRGAMCQWIGAMMTTATEITVIEITNQRKDSWVEMAFVESFCVTPVIPQNTYATSA